MSERPTPEEIIGGFMEPYSASSGVIVEALAEHGYVIVHPDDVPERELTGVSWEWESGWNDCRSHIFGDA